jgi:hypothetical protein
MTAMASGHDDDHGHDAHDDHGHAADDSFWVVPPLVVGAVIGIVLAVILGIGTDTVLYHSPFN